MAVTDAMRCCPCSERSSRRNITAIGGAASGRASGRRVGKSGTQPDCREDTEVDEEQRREDRCAMHEVLEQARGQSADVGRGVEPEADQAGDGKR